MGATTEVLDLTQNTLMYVPVRAFRAGFIRLFNYLIRSLHDDIFLTRDTYSVGFSGSIRLLIYPV